MLTATPFTIAKPWKPPKCPLRDGRINRMWYVYITEYYSAMKNEMMPLAATLTELEVITLNQVNQKERDKCRITCMQSPKRDQINLFTKQKHTRRHIK